jgi:hypothetical protein
LPDDHPVSKNMVSGCNNNNDDDDDDNNGNNQGHYSSDGCKLLLIRFHSLS